MNLTSLLGLLALYAIAWGMSYHRTRVRLRTVFWGLGLQILFATIILSEATWSFIGMGVFATLIATYILRGTDDKRIAPWPVTVAWIAGVAVVSAGVSLLDSRVQGWALIALIAALVASARIRPLVPLRRAGALLFLGIGVGYLVSQGTTGQMVFQALSVRVATFLSLSDYGAAFLFGNLVDSSHYFTAPDAGWPGFGFQFAFKVLPTIIFFGAFMSVLYHLGIIQVVIQSMARFMRWTLGTSGAETLSCSANIFVGQTEAPLLIKPFLNEMTRSELLTVMVGGFATIAGGVLAGYIAMGVPAAHLIAASVMAAPAALVIGKVVFPETEHSATAGDVELPDIETGDNVIEAATNGISDGFRLALNVGAMLIGFIALIAVIDVSLNWMDSLIDGRLLGGAQVAYSSGGMSPVVGEYVGVFPGSLQTLFGTILRPLAWLMGVPWSEAHLVANLIGIKLSLNEFVAYGTLKDYMQSGALSPRAVNIATYALCGFANFSSIGIQIGGISAIAPKRKSDLAKLGLKAMFAGAIVSCTTATIASVFL